MRVKRWQKLHPSLKSHHQLANTFIGYLSFVQWSLTEYTNYTSVHFLIPVNSLPAQNKINDIFRGIELLLICYFLILYFTYDFCLCKCGGLFIYLYLCVVFLGLFLSFLFCYCFILFWFVYLFLIVFFFLVRTRENRCEFRGIGVKDLRVFWNGKPMIKIYCMKK